MEVVPSNWHGVCLGITKGKVSYYHFVFFVCLYIIITGFKVCCNAKFGLVMHSAWWSKSLGGTMILVRWSSYALSFSKIDVKYGGVCHHHATGVSSTNLLSTSIFVGWRMSQDMKRSYGEICKTHLLLYSTWKRHKHLWKIYKTPCTYLISSTNDGYI